ncbi:MULTISPECIES: penicillin-binding protein 2 [unclassified Bradyrhizobium]|uniref:peptidoglycan D,D-transpeptidase FtsI family protein n=1 Tax=unclassified Bradyrhizobium TaxID=2631580 RepID=UPI0028EA92DB|nr:MULTISPECIES: penicillin-binding protein 2 [unclassified Bradyrhizobium]
MTNPANRALVPQGRVNKERTKEPWHQRLVRTLLYGRNVDRAAKARARVGLAMIAFAAVYAIIGGRLVMFALGADGPNSRRAAQQDAVATARPDIVDRNGEVLATDVKTPSLFGEPRRLIDKDEAIELLTATLPDLDTAEVRDRLSSKKGFVWLKREITPQQQFEIHKLGIPGIGFLRENKRVYPTGNEVAHVIGLVNIDNQGIAGMEKWLDNQGLADLHRAGFATDRLQRPIELSVDLRVEHALRDELLKAKDKFHAKAASGIVANVNTGEIVAMVSLPDFDPNSPKEAHDPDRINRLTTGVYEMGSTFKAFTLAMALDTGKYGLDSMWDARGPLHYGKFTIHDDEPKGRFLSMKEVFYFSSNVGAARIALSQGVDAHKAFLRKMGQLDRLRTELPESASPLVPKRWGDLNTITIAFGHGMAVAPLQAVMGVSALANGGLLIPPTFLKRSEEEARAIAKRVIKPETSEKMRYLMRLNAEVGTARKADVKGYYIGGKTGTAEKVINGRYAKKKVLTAFTAIIPADKPRYQLLIMLDEPQPLKETYGFITSGWNAVPTAGNVISRIGPLLGIEPRFDLPPSDRQILAASRLTQ